MQAGEWAPWVSIIAAAVTVVGGGVFMILNRRGGDRAKREPTWGELVKENRDLRQELEDYRTKTDNRFAALERKVGALVNVIVAAAEQWPEGHPPPEFDTSDVEILADTLPVRFRRGRPRRRASPA